jgi:rhomboid protease GluP
MNWFRRLREAPATLALILVNVVVFAVMVVSSRRLFAFPGLTLIEAGSSVYAPDAAFSHWRWLTAAFVHVNLLHIFMNLWVLGQIGALAERALGRGLFVASYVVTGVVGNALSYALAASRHEVINSAGASGAIMGLIGMAATYAWISGQRPAARALAFNILFVLGVGLSLSAGGVRLVDNAAHVGGLVAGVLLGLGRVRVSRPLPRWLDAALIGASFLATSIAFLVVRLQPLPLD